MKCSRIKFESIATIWGEKLWPDRSSAIEPISVMTWPFEGDPEPFDMGIFAYPPTFWGIEVDNRIVGVNSGHRTSPMHYRSRGIWVEPAYRGRGFANKLFTFTEHQAILEGCEMIWSIPRKTALSSYTKYGVETVGDFIKTETSDANIYVKKQVTRSDLFIHL